MPGRRVSKKEVVRLVKKYKKSGERNNTKSVWLSLADVQEVVTLITNLTNSANGKTGDGVRLYFARYPQNASDVSRRDRNTIVFVPTYKLNGDNTHHDFISPDEVQRLSDEIGDPDSSTDELTRNGGDGEEGYNHSELCPSDCGGGNVGGV
jgi:hypothetical protein